MTYEYEGTITHVVDGDTVDAEIQLGFHVAIRERFRLYGINAPEMKGDSKDAGIASKAHLMSLVEETGPHFKFFTVKGREQEKYGRWLASIAGSGDGEPVNLNDRMLRDGHAVPAPESWG